MFIEFCGGGALDSIMVDLEKPLTEDQIRFVTHEMVKGLDHLHKHRVIHRDLKAGNVLVTMEGDVKLGKAFSCECLWLKRISPNMTSVFSHLFLFVVQEPFHSCYSDECLCFYLSESRPHEVNSWDATTESF